jgi:hypothetical protein
MNDLTLQNDGASKRNKGRFAFAEKANAHTRAMQSTGKSNRALAAEKEAAEAAGSDVVDADRTAEIDNPITPPSDPPVAGGAAGMAGEDET